MLEDFTAPQLHSLPTGERLRILMVAPYVPSPIRVRPYNLLRALAARGHHIHLICASSSANDVAALAALRPYATLTAVAVSRAASAMAYLRALPGSLPLQTAHCLTPEFVRATRAAMREHGFDIVHIEHLRAAEIARQAAAGLSAPPPLVLDAVDSISLLFERTVRHGANLRSRAIALLDLARTRRYEASYSRRFAQILITSPEDRWAIATLREHFGAAEGAALTVVPNGVDLEYFQPGNTARAAATIVFSGKMSYHANEAAALYLLREIMPLVWQTQPAARVVIAGAEPGPALIAQHNAGPITVTGAVPDLRPYLAGATIAVAPIRYGVGVQNKVLEAMAMGTPVVAARQATIALGARPGIELLVADTSAEFADQIISLLSSPQRRNLIAAAGRAYVERRHSWETSAAILEQCYTAMLQQRSGA
jgi:polysaccharide biosynthesis protein PslH